MSLGAVGAISLCVWWGGWWVGEWGGVAAVASSRVDARNDAPPTDLGCGEVNVPVIGFVSLSWFREGR